jgi:hypothetical protein
MKTQDIFKITQDDKIRKKIFLLRLTTDRLILGLFNDTISTAL